MSIDEQVLVIDTYIKYYDLVELSNKKSLKITDKNYKHLKANVDRCSYRIVF